jgi:ribonucleotide monophosphatase NagD (HAD superfamily)
VESLPENWSFDHVADMVAKADPIVKCVIIGFDRNFNYMQIVKATNFLLREDSHFLVTV